MAHSSVFISIFIFSVIAGVHGKGALAIVGAGSVFLFEIWYLFRFVRRQVSINAAIGVLLFVLSCIVYAVLFPFINSFELWVDEIEVIRFARMPLADIAQAVMTKHVAVPPLDYWNMWVWNKVVVLLPVHVWEYAYRVPYMFIHSLAAVVLGLTCWELVKAPPRLRMLTVLCGFLLYFFNPLLFAYSYEVRFYAMTFLGAAVVAVLYSRGRLFVTENVPLVLLFCLNSIYQFIILVPFICYGVIGKSTRKNALLLGGSAALVALIILPFLYIPHPVETIQANRRIVEGLYGLSALYFNTPWRQYLVYLFIVALCLLRRKKSLFLLGATAFYVLVIIALDTRYNYRYFSGKHFLFIMPFCTVVAYELFLLSRAVWFRASAIVLMSVVFLYPFYGHMHKMYTKEFIAAKSPMGLKEVFGYAVDNNIERIIVEYGDTSAENIAYYQLAVTWYSEIFRQLKVDEFAFRLGCAEFMSSPSSLMYSVASVPFCYYPPATKIIHLYDAAMIVRR
ncbi:hypothetical protein KJZ67_00845 [Patescibacteria group bacterium]|nr:hypothetical protein [Patescibacteria group bacterium]